MKKLKWVLGLLCLLVILVWLAACAPAAIPTPAAAQAAPLQSGALETSQAAHDQTNGAPSSQLNPENPAKEAVSSASPAPSATSASLPLPTRVSAMQTPPLPSAEEYENHPRSTEQRMIELEYPLEMRLGESDLLRLALVPFEDSYTVTAEFPEHTVKTQTVTVERPKGYVLSGIARLDAAGFDVSPQVEQERQLLVGETVTWRWSLVAHSAGKQRLAISLLLRWEPETGISGPSRQAEAFSRALEMNVSSFMGLSRMQALSTGFTGLIFGSMLSLAALVSARRPVRRFTWQMLLENPRVNIEPFPNLELGKQEKRLLQALFNRYDRLIIENEFLSGYSGARTFLARPIRPDGLADAATIIKMGARRTIQGEFENYEAYVKDRLPPITARIQQAPITVKDSPLAALQYTFIAEPEHPPTSLRQALLQNPDPALIQRLFDTFGPSWWMQRQPATFRWGQEYDRLLPPHLALEPLSSAGNLSIHLSENSIPSHLNLIVGDQVWVQPFKNYEMRADGQSLTLTGLPQPGEPALRLRWLSPQAPAHPTPARVRSLRTDLLAHLTSDLLLAGLPDPLNRLPSLLYQSVTASQSVIHGDLNLENILVGPGGFVWLIDFARTRPGHPLFDFAHLEAEIIAHVLAPRQYSQADYLSLLQQNFDPLLHSLEDVASRCLFNPSQPQEYHTALGLACLGALKFANLTPQARQYLYLTAAYYLQ